MTRRGFISLLLLTAVAAGCRIEPPLYLRERLYAEFVLEDHVEVLGMWPPDWESIWNFRWNEQTLGPLGYGLPASHRVHIYPLDENGKHIDYAVRNFNGFVTEVPVSYGRYDFLFHNNDSEVLLFSQAPGTEDDVFCNTRPISRGLRSSSLLLTVQQKANGTKADDLGTGEEPVALMPDALFTCFDANREISGDLSLYTYKDGRYVRQIKEDLYPLTFIHLVQIRLVNNEGRVVGSAGGAAITGVADGVNLHTLVTADGTVSIPMDVYMDREREMLAARVLTFGIPGCNPHDKASVDASESRHFLVLNVAYNNGTYRNVRIDITDQFRAQPLGGVIDLTLDVNDFPPEGGAAGGFVALIEEWDEETGTVTIIN